MKRPSDARALMGPIGIRAIVKLHVRLRGHEAPCVFDDICVSWALGAVLKGVHHAVCEFS